MDDDAFRNNESFQLAVQMHVRRYFRADGSLPIAEEVILPVLQSAEIEAMRPLYKRLMGQALTNMIVGGSQEIKALLAEAEALQPGDEDTDIEADHTLALNKVKAIFGKAQEIQKQVLWINALVEAIPNA